MTTHPLPQVQTDLDLDAYLDRIDYHGALEPTLATLEALHFQHVTHIPFENLDIQMGKPIRLDLESLQAKLVEARRGGYCFEHSSLFGAVLRRLGYQVKTLEARVRPLGASSLLPRTHIVLSVLLEGEEWLTDVGFGGDGLLGPAPLDGREMARFGEVHRIHFEDHLRVLQIRRPNGWEDLYAIHPHEVFPIDLEVGNHFTSTHPQSRFVLTLTAQIPAPGVRYILRNRTFSIQKGDCTESRELTDEEMFSTLREYFGIHVPEGAVFRALIPKLASSINNPKNIPYSVP